MYCFLIVMLAFIVETSTLLTIFYLLVPSFLFRILVLMSFAASGDKNEVPIE